MAWDHKGIGLSLRFTAPSRVGQPFQRLRGAGAVGASDCSAVRTVSFSRKEIVRSEVQVGSSGGGGV